jgi:RNA polymerase sigma factor (sigma-70 family)
VAAEESIFSHGDMGSGAGDTLSDAELIAATRAGDATSFAVLYTRHVDAAHACARRLVRSRSEADDLVAEGFAKVLSALRRGKGPDLAFRPYLLTAVRNALYDRTRRDSRVEFTDEPPEPVNAVLLAADYEREDRAMVAQAYAALPERWQLVLWHADVEGRQPAEIAPLLGISANSVAALAYRAREGLRQAYLNAHVHRGVDENCKGTTEKLSAYVRDGLSARDRRTVQEHLDQCTGCTALLAELEEANRSLKIVLIPVLAGVSAAAYLGGLPGGGVTRLVRRNPGPTAAGAVAAAAVIVFAAVALRSPGSGDAAQALTPPPLGSGRPTTTTTTTTTVAPTTAPRTTLPTATTTPYVVPTFDTAIPPITNVPYNPNATTATTVRRPTPTTRPTTTTRAPTTTTTTTTTPAAQPGATATTTTTTTTTTTPANTQPPPAPPALQSTVTGLGPVYSGQNAYFSVKVSNAASGNGGSARKVAVGPAEGVVVSFNLPPGTSFTGASSPDWQCDVIGSTVRCLLPRLDAGVATEAVFSLDVPAGTGGNLTISPTVMINGGRIDAKPTSRAVTDGAAIADFTVAPGAELVVAGNTLLDCPSPPNVNCDGGTKALVSSSSAAIELGGAQVANAYLVWQGSGTPDGTVKLAGPGAAPVDVGNAMVTPGAGGWAAIADVTSIVQAAGSGTYAVSDVAIPTGSNDFGGWALVVTVVKPGAPMRGIAIKAPASDIQNNSTIVSFGGLQPSAAPRAVDVVALVAEGDPGLPNNTAESMAVVDPAANQGLVPLVSELHPGDGNAYRSAAVGTAPGTNTYGTDLDRYRATQDQNRPSIDVQAATGPDQVWISAVAVAFDL